jgi:hypothetical protein
MQREHKDNFEAGELKQGLNMFGRCFYPKCRKKFVVKLGLGTFIVGKKKGEGDYFYPNIIDDDLEKERLYRKKKAYFLRKETMKDELGLVGDHSFNS